MGKESGNFEQRLERQRIKLAEENLKKKNIRLKKEKLDTRKRKEAIKNPIYKKMRDIANSEELKEAILKYFDVFSFGVEQPNIKIFDSFEKEGPTERDPFGRITITIVLGEDIYDREHPPTHKTRYLCIYIDCNEEKNLRIGYKRLRKTSLTTFKNLDELLNTIAKDVISYH